MWVKQGLLRREWLEKALGALAALGLLIALVAVTFPPGLVAECGPVISESTRTVRTPLKTVLLLDASASISGATWGAEKRAAQGIIQAFAEVYAPATDRVHVGVAQFATDARREISITSDLAAVDRALDGMAQMSGGTEFGKALDICASQLRGYAGAGAEAFDLCVLITDGESGEDPSSLAGGS